MGVATSILCSSGVFFHRSPEGQLVSPSNDHVGDILSMAPEVSSDGIEVLVTRRMVGSLNEAAKRLAGKLRIPVVHAPKHAGALLPSNEGVTQLEEATRFAFEVGARSVVLHLWDMPASDEDFDNRLEAAVIAADLAAAHGIRLLIETIPCRVHTPLTNIKRVLDHEPRAGVTLDTEFLALHGELEKALHADWLWEGDLVGHIHVKDFDGNLADPDGNRRYLMPGAGGIDFPEVFRVLDERGFAGTVSLEAAVHLSDGRPDLEAARRALSRMSHSPWTFS